MTDNANCEFEGKRTSSHLFEYTLIPSKCETKEFAGPTEITDEIIKTVDC
jgi:hypothetical protein